MTWGDYRDGAVVVAIFLFAVALVLAVTTGSEWLSLAVWSTVALWMVACFLYVSVKVAWGLFPDRWPIWFRIVAFLPAFAAVAAVLALLLYVFAG